MFFGVLTYEAKEYLTAFTYIVVGLSILGIYLLLKKLITIVNGRVSLGLFVVILMNLALSR